MDKPIAPANFDRIAPFYRWMEHLAFANCLQVCRVAALPKLKHCRRALVLGDGDGRFLEALLASNRELRADVVDGSSEMLSLLRKRVSGYSDEGRVRIYECDIFDLTPPADDYDLVVTHFFLDCFRTSEVANIVGRIPPHLAPSALWVVSEFAVPEKGFASLVARAMVRSLYFGFRILTGLRVQHLPDYESAFHASGLRLVDRRTWLAGMVSSETWHRQDYGS